MNTKIVDQMWSISLIVIGIATFILAVSNIAAIELPDIMIRVLGVIELVSLPVLVFSTIKKLKAKS